MSLKQMQILDSTVALKQEPVIDKSAAIRIATALGWAPQRKPLTDEEIILIVAECAASHQHTDIHFARAIERAHGIKELV